jgi:hypothetical protein
MKVSASSTILLTLLCSVALVAQQRPQPTATN